MYTNGKVYATWKSYDAVTNKGTQPGVLAYTGGVYAWSPLSSPSGRVRYAKFHKSSGDASDEIANHFFGPRPALRQKKTFE